MSKSEVYLVYTVSQISIIYFRNENEKRGYAMVMLHPLKCS